MNPTRPLSRTKFPAPSRRRGLGLSVAVLATLLISSQAALAQFSQQGPKLVGTGAIGAASQGYSVALSGDGTTAIAGGRTDNGGVGAAWVYTRSGAVWTQQAKLVGTGAIGNAQQGFAVALSADGNTAVVGGPEDNGGTGAVWVYTRSGASWTQQGDKLVGAGAVGSPKQGYSVSLSSDGNTAIMGGPCDDMCQPGQAGNGAAWVFTRSGVVWTQQGAKLVGTGAIGFAAQGASVSLAGDGNTAIVGGYGDNGSYGAAWVFIRSGSVWTQQGGKLAGTGAGGNASQGRAVALSTDGNTAIVGGHQDSFIKGAAWIFTRSGGVWTQQGNKLVGTGAVGFGAGQGVSVSLSGDGNTALVGGYQDNDRDGAAWVFIRSGGVWTQLGNKLVGEGAIGNFVGQAFSVALSADGNTAIIGGPCDNAGCNHLQTGGTGAAWVFVNVTPPLACDSPSRLADFNGDARADMLLRRTDGLLSIYFMNGLQIASASIVGQIGTEFTLVGVGDFSGDGKADMLLRRNDGTLALYLMNGAQVQAAQLLGSLGTEWSVIGVGDFNGDGRADFLIRRPADGMLALYLMNGFQVAGAQLLGTVGTEWTLAQIADFNGDGRADMLFRRADGTLALYLMNGFQVVSATVLGNVGPEWRLVAAGDFNGDARADMLFRRGDGTLSIYLLNGPQVTAAQVIGNVGLEFEFIGNGDLNGDARSDLLFRRSDGMISAYLVDGFQVLGSALLGNVGTEWSSCYGQGGGGIARVSGR